jgi:riboflavin synthase
MTNIELNMFTGIIEELGVVKSIAREGNLLRLGITVPFVGDVKIGDSISVNGVCLTISRLGTGSDHTTIFRGTCLHRLIYFEVMQETLKTTNLSRLKLNDKVNLEQALKAGDRLGGHFVTGHIDTAGIIRKKTGSNEQTVFQISVPAEFTKGIVKKGSIAVDGISLTAIDVNEDTFSIGIIPHTLKSTTLGFKRPGDTVNIELDIMAKHFRQNSQDILLLRQSKITEDFLNEHGF